MTFIVVTEDSIFAAPFYPASAPAKARAP